jgi:hypothetical protein
LVFNRTASIFDGEIEHKVELMSIYVRRVGVSRSFHDRIGYWTVDLCWNTNDDRMCWDSIEVL